MRHRRRSLALILVLVALTGACSDDGKGAPADTGSSAATTPALDVDPQDVKLVPFDTCDEFTNYMRSQAKDRVTDTGLPGVTTAAPGPSPIPSVSPSPVGTPTPAATPPDTAVSTGSPAPGASTSTTTTAPPAATTPRAEDADVLSVSGFHVVTVVSGRLQVVDLSTGNAAVVGTLVLPDNITNAKVVVSGDRAVVVGQSTRPADPSLDANSEIAKPPPGSPEVVLVDVDISNPAAPAIRSTLTLDGTLLTTRRVGDSARVVFYSQPLQLPFVAPAAGTAAAREQARRTNEQIVTNSTPDDWRPRFTLKTAAGTTSEGAAVACELVNKPPVFAGFGMTSILTLDLKGHIGSEDVVSVLGDSGTVHASDRSLLVTTSEWLDPRLVAAGKAPARPDFITAVHSFDLTGVGPSAYAGSTGLRGHLAGPTPLLTTDVAIRAATVEGPPWTNPSTPLPGLLTTIDVSDGQFVPVSTLENLGGQAGMLSLRYAGDVGYLVDGHLGDPLTLVDLRDAKAATVGGTVAPLTGLSARLFPFGPGKVVGIGPAFGFDGRPFGLVIDLFDVTNPAAPTKQAETVLPGLSLGSADDLAVLLDPASQTIGIPARSADNSFSGMVLVRPNPLGLGEVGRIAPPGGTDFSLHRAVVIGSRLVTISPLGVQAFDLATLTGGPFQAFPPG